MSYLIRYATPEDSAEIARLHQTSIETAFRGLLSDQYVDRRTAEQFLNMWQEYFQRGGGDTYLAHSKNDPAPLVGFISVGRSPDADAAHCGEIDRLYLLPAAWGTGLGKILLERGEQRLIELKYPAIKLWVFEKNIRARGFYERCGYQLDGRDKTSDTELLLRYEKSGTTGTY